MKLPESIIEAAAVYELFPSIENAKAFVDELGKWVVREIVGKAVVDLLMAKLDEGPQSGGFVPLDIPGLTDQPGRPISLKKAPTVVTPIHTAEFCGYCGGAHVHVWDNCQEGPL